MNVKESGDDRVYLTVYDIPTLTFGSGGILINTLLFKDDPLKGVGFSLTDSRIVGEDEPKNIGKKANDVDVFLQLLFTNDDSIDVLITALNYIKDSGK